jgi:GTP-binding protein LepA
MNLERKKGITIKSHPVTMAYKAKNEKTSKLDLLNTPGHMDFHVRFRAPRLPAKGRS